jgi:prefoldin subunit 5
MLKKTIDKKIDLASKKADEAIAVFKQAQTKLESGTEALHLHIAELDGEIDRLQKLKDQAVKQLKQNEGFIAKILDFIGL